MVMIKLGIAWIIMDGIADETLLVLPVTMAPWKPHHIDKYNHRAAKHLKGMKGDIYEAGHRVPFIVRWPNRISKGSVAYGAHSLANFYATVAELLSTPSKALDSYSLLGQLTNSNSLKEVNPIIHHSSLGHFAIRYGDWKMIEKRGSGGFTQPTNLPTPRGETPERLFNLKDDPSENSNISYKFPKN